MWFYLSFFKLAAGFDQGMVGRATCLFSSVPCSSTSGGSDLDI